MLLMFAVIYIPVIAGEERYLRQTFPDYDDYARHVPRMLPRLTPYGSGAKCVFFRTLLEAPRIPSQHWLRCRAGRLVVKLSSDQAGVVVCRWSMSRLPQGLKPYRNAARLAPHH